NLDCFLRWESAGTKDHFAGKTLADDTRDVLRCAHGGAGTDLCAGLTENSVVRGNHDVAPEGELVTTAHAPAIDHGDDRNMRAAQAHGAVEHAVVPMAGDHPVKPHHRTKIASGAEGTIAGAGDDHRGDGRIAL